MTALKPRTCPNCGSTHVKFKGNVWRCQACKHRSDIYEAMKIMTTNVPRAYLLMIEEFKKANIINSRSDFVRDALRNFLNKEIKIRASMEEFGIYEKLNEADNPLQIITVNVETETLIEAEIACNGEGFYSSRSELTRHAIKEELLRRLPQIKKKESILEEGDVIKIPLRNENGDVAYKSYKVIKRLDDNGD